MRHPMNTPMLAPESFTRFRIAGFVTALQAADFAQWRGPLRDGHSPETGLLQEWPKDGPKLLWQVTNGSAVIPRRRLGDRIYLLGSDASEETVYALNAEGWQQSLGGEVGQGRTSGAAAELSRRADDADGGW
jgi:hypothetical protein